MTVQLYVSYYGNKQDHSKSIHIDRLGISECALVCLHLNDMANCHNKTHLTEQSFSVAGFPPCICTVMPSSGTYLVFNLSKHAKISEYIHINTFFLHLTEIMETMHKYTYQQG